VPPPEPPDPLEVIVDSDLKNADVRKLAEGSCRIDPV